MGVFDNLFSRRHLNGLTYPLRRDAADALKDIVMAPARGLNDAVQSGLRGGRGGFDGVQPRPGPYSAGEVNGMINRPGGDGYRGNRLGGRPGEEQMLTAQQLAIMVKNGRISDHEADKMINEGRVRLPDPRTIKTQAPAPVEDRSIRVGAEPPATSAAALGTAATPAVEAQTSPVAPPAAVESRSLDEPPKAHKVSGLAAQEFAQVSPNPPAKQVVEGVVVKAPGTALDELAAGKAEGRFDSSIYERARQQLARVEGPGGMS